MLPLQLCWAFPCTKVGGDHASARGRRTPPHSSGPQAVQNKSAGLGCKVSFHKFQPGFLQVLGLWWASGITWHLPFSCGVSRLSPSPLSPCPSWPPQKLQAEAIQPVVARGRRKCNLWGRAGPGYWCWVPSGRSFPIATPRRPFSASVAHVGCRVLSGRHLTGTPGTWKQEEGNAPKLLYCGLASGPSQPPWTLPGPLHPYKV